ncbi:MAG: hypothetical protein P8L37_03270 [Phycisphaerales bacterium]|nr:hypothetical protein [Phycisphaerales bacterium]
MKLMTTIAIAAMSLLLNATAYAELTASQRESILAEAQADYDTGTSMLKTDPAEAVLAFRSSAERFQLLANDGISNGALFYDLGNAWYQAGDLGRAIASYLRAQRLMPDDPRLEANLNWTRSLVRPQIATDDHEALVRRLAFWHDGWSLRTRLTLFATAWLVLWAALLIRVLRRYPGWNYVSGAGAAVAVLIGGSILMDVAVTNTRTTGVLVGEDIVVRKGNAESFQPQFEEPMHQGVEFKVLEERPDWLHIEFNNGSSGWIPASDAEIVKASRSPTLHT